MVQRREQLAEKVIDEHEHERERMNMRMRDQVYIEVGMAS